MRTQRIVPHCLAALALALIAAPAQTELGSGHPSCAVGTASGAWDLPNGSQSFGIVDGWLTSSGGQPLFHFVASLEEVPQPCLSCTGGGIVGTLDDGIGPGPDFVVRGDYLGGWFSGRGEFDTRVFRPGSFVSLGSIYGIYNDPPPLTGPGTFVGRWRICE